MGIKDFIKGVKYIAEIAKLQEERDKLRDERANLQDDITQMIESETTRVSLESLKAQVKQMLARGYSYEKLKVHATQAEYDMIAEASDDEMTRYGLRFDGIIVRQEDNISRGYISGLK